MLEFKEVSKEINYLKVRLVDRPTRDSQSAVGSVVGQVQPVASQGNSFYKGFECTSFMPCLAGGMLGICH